MSVSAVAVPLSWRLQIPERNALLVRIFPFINATSPLVLRAKLKYNTKILEISNDIHTIIDYKELNIYSFESYGNGIFIRTDNLFNWFPSEYVKGINFHQSLPFNYRNKTVLKLSVNANCCWQFCFIRILFSIPLNCSKYNNRKRQVERNCVHGRSEVNLQFTQRRYSVKYPRSWIVLENTWTTLDK